MLRGKRKMRMAKRSEKARETETKEREREREKEREREREREREWIGLQRVNRLSTRREILLYNDVKLTIGREARQGEARRDELGKRGGEGRGGEAEKSERRANSAPKDWRLLRIILRNTRQRG
jgi:hypothetical protein